MGGEVGGAVGLRLVDDLVVAVPNWVPNAEEMGFRRSVIVCDGDNDEVGERDCHRDAYSVGATGRVRDTNA